MKIMWTATNELYQGFMGILSKANGWSEWTLQVRCGY